MLRKHLDSQKYRVLTPERAFVEWYVLARFGNVSDAKILDGKKDGGIDALVENSGKLYVIQSKYEVLPRVSIVTRNEIASFEKIARYFRETGGQGEFLSWLSTVRGDLQGTYKNVRKRALEKPDEVRFIFITTKRFQLEEGDLVEVEDVESIASLWYLYSEGFTPPTEFINLALPTSAGKGLVE